MATKFGMEPVVDSAFGAVRYNSVAHHINSDADFAAHTALTGVRASSEDLANRPGGAAIADRFVARTNVIETAFTDAGTQRAAYRATLTPPTVEAKASVGGPATAATTGKRPALKTLDS